MGCARKRRLNGVSRVVGGDPYELRIAKPARGEWKLAEVTSRMSAAAKPSDRGRGGAWLARADDSPETRDVKWQLSFHAVAQ